MPSLFLGFWSKRTFIWTQRMQELPDKLQEYKWGETILYYWSTGLNFGWVNLNHFTDVDKLCISFLQQYQHVSAPVGNRITCNKVVDDGIGALICVHGPGNVPHHSTWTGVFRHCQLLVRQAATLRCKQTHKRTHFNIISYVQATILGHIQRASFSPVVWGRRAHCRQCPTAPPA